MTAIALSRAAATYSASLGLSVCHQQIADRFADRSTPRPFAYRAAQVCNIVRARGGWGHGSLLGGVSHAALRRPEIAPVEQ